ncbi:MAG: PIN domain-containing protein [Prevotella sp.]|nr:PIN domain-containing protein [Prevotella sp.]
MKRVFLDTNVLLDFVLLRAGEREAGQILARGDRGLFEVCASFLTFANVAYILRKYPRQEVYSILEQMEKAVTVLPMDAGQLKAAIAAPVEDFEDMLQYQCAKAYDCDFVVTGNKKHWSFSDIPVFTSLEFLARN